MTRIKFTRDYRFAHDGIHVVAYTKGQIVDLLNEHEVGVITGVGAAIEVKPDLVEVSEGEEVDLDDETTDETTEEEVIDETIPETERTKDSPTVKTRKGGKK